MNNRDIEAIKSNIAKMIIQGAPQEDIDSYLHFSGVSKAQLSKKPTDWNRIGWQIMGGMGGGTVGAGTLNPLAIPVGIGLGSGMAGQAYDLAMEKMGKKNPEPLSQRMLHGAEDVMMDTISPAATSKLLSGGKSAATKMLGRGRFKSADMSDFAKVGVKPSAAVATQSKPLGYAESALGDYAFSGSVIQKHAEKNLTSVKKKIVEISRGYGNILNRQEIGVVLQKASRTSIDKRIAITDKLFSGLSKEMGNTPHRIDNVLNIAKTFASEAKRGPESSINRTAKEIIMKAQRGISDPIQKLASVKKEPGLSFEDLKNYRSRVGELMNNPILRANSTAKQSDLKRLYGALTQDMEAATLKAGTKMNAKWRAMNQYYDISVNVKMPILEEMAGKKIVEEVYDVAIRNMQKGGTRLALIRSQIDKKSWGDVAGTVLGRLGRSTASAQDDVGEAFSVQTFMTNWNKLAPGAKKALFRGTRYANLSKELDSFVRVASDMKNIDKLANTSKTGSVLSFYSIIGNMGGMATGAVTGAATGSALAGIGIGAGTMIVAPKQLAKLITNEKFVRWLTTGAKITKISPNSMKAHLGRLFVLREEENIKDGIDSIINHITSEGKVIQ